jgi:ABC-type cobalamin transport system ATPase subunit
LKCEDIAERQRVRILMVPLEFSIDLNPSSHTLVLGSPQPVTKMSTQNHSAGKGWLVRKAEGLTAIRELIV